MQNISPKEAAALYRNDRAAWLAYKAEQAAFAAAKKAEAFARFSLKDSEKDTGRD